jgi:predicted nucleotidyltransferase
MRPISEEEMRGYVEGFRARSALLEARRQGIEARAKETLARCVEQLRAIPEVRRIILYGSLAKGTFDMGSDIDLVIEGLPMEAHLRLASALDRDAPFDVDLQRWEELRDDFRRVVQSHGRVLYERP